ncbi:MAG: NADH:ubiquinone reductase (Na(+)-transporting) subunit B [Prolixibacteraceae bacterium]|jgi:Na+-transporting NADH:ubiquinone oxidoreductase subunit B|nr:NADH:ubiquinone reductase (Na(+)-transporting) subunit B [Prolixibacteraceae bacterium]
MKGQGIKNFYDKHRPKFEKGGKLHPFQSVFEGFETFLYVPDKTTKKGSHVRDYIDLKRTMIFVVLAVVPTMLFGMYNIGYQHFHAIGEFAQTGFWEVFFYGFLRVLPAIVVSYVVGLGIEFTFAQIKGHEINEGYLVSGILIPLIIPIDTPLWMVAIAVAFSVIIAKEAFGGTGMNIWNPALIARAFLFFAYPAHMSGDSVWIRLGQDADKVVDGFSGATPLGLALTGNIDYNIWDAFWGFIPGSIGETSTFAILLGAAFLIITGIGSWRIMLATVIGALFTGLILNTFAVNPFMEIPFWHHLFLGGFAFGAVFMTTDPVSAAQTTRGKWIYGLLIGVLAIIIRVLNPAYPEGVMLAILLMNTFAPLIDHYVVQGNVRKRLKRAPANV